VQKEEIVMKKEILELREELIRLRRDFHAHPEPGFEEYRTAQIVENCLKDLGLDVSRCAGTGVVGLLRGKEEGKTVMLRADIDALPVTEETGLPFQSERPGVMHACGHDGHTAMLLTAAKILTRHRERIRGNIKFVFQPNEEDAGAQAMIDEGVLERPRVDSVLGLHLWSHLETGMIGVAPGPVMASSYYFRLSLHGKGGHGGAPHEAINPIGAAAAVIEASKSLTSGELNVLEPTLLTICKISAGTKATIIPETLEMEGSLRCLHNGTEAVQESFRKKIAHICGAYRTTFDLDFKCGNNVLSNDPEMTNLAVRSAEETAGRENVTDKNLRTMLGDDFAEFSRLVPGVYCFVGTANQGKGTNYPHHHPKFNIDEDSLPIGVELQVRLALAAL
jgi:amidohydrolase